MTIETGSAQNTSRPASSTDSHHAKGKTGGAGNQGQSGQGGFMAILASLDSCATASPTTNSEVDPSLQAYGAAARVVSEADADIGALRPTVDTKDGMDPGSTLDDAFAKLLQDVPVDGAKVELSAPIDGTPVGLPIDTNVLAPTELPPESVALLAQSLQWSATPIAQNVDSVNPDRVVAGPAIAASAGPKLPSSYGQLLGANAPASMDAPAERPPLASAAKAHKDAAEKLAVANAALAQSTSADAVGQSDSRASAFMASKWLEQPLTPVATALAMVNAVAPARREEATKERSVFRSTVTEVGALAQTYAPTGPGAQAASALAPMAPTDLYVAEKVAYWITNDVQNAEMKLDGIGVEPVEVSIRMHGNEAHIAFRTDEVLARSALESASQHLKDLLQREGLVLSGVSVGTSGAGDSGGQDRKPRQGVRQSSVAAVQPARLDRLSGASRTTGGALDLFV